MSGKGRARREASAAADRADQATRDLQNQKDEIKKRADEEKKKSQRILIRSMRAGSGGYFSSDSSKIGGGDSLG